MADEINDPKDVALVALTNLIRLMGAELVAGCHRDDVDLLERAVRAKVGDVTVVGGSAELAGAGIALARSHVERALAQIRVQADEARTTDLKKAALLDPAGAIDAPKLILQ